MKKKTKIYLYALPVIMVLVVLTLLLTEEGRKTVLLGGPRKVPLLALATLVVLVTLVAKATSSFSGSFQEMDEASLKGEFKPVPVRQLITVIVLVTVACVVAFALVGGVKPW